MSSKKFNLVLFGGNRKNEDGPLLNIIPHVLKKFHVTVFSDPFRLNLPTKNGKSLKNRLEDMDVELHACDHLDYELLKKYVNSTSIGLSIGSIWFFKQNVIDLFNDNLFNYHNTLLPTERGASAYTWKILSQNRLGGLTIHKIEETLDVGNIITQIKFNFPRFCYTQKDYYDFISKRETRFIINFLNSLVSGRKYKQIKQIEKFSTYWPKLDTQLHGYLDWNWSVKEIVLFIRAFDDPHPGAMTFIGGKKVHLKKCVTHKEKIHFHPFQTGLVFRICERRLHVATKDGCLLINNILDDDGNDITSTIKLGHRFHTPISFLDNAKTTRSSYGDEVKKVRT